LAVLSFETSALLRLELHPSPKLSDTIHFYNAW
jgi:hypothetical protein